MHVNRRLLLGLMASVAAVMVASSPAATQQTQKPNTGPQMLGGMYVSSAPLYFPKVYNIEMDQHEDLNIGAYNLWPMEPVAKVVREYLESLKKYPNPPAVNFTNFSEH